MAFDIKELKNLGMKQDSSPSKMEEGFAYENRNIRITSIGESTLMSITNEKGPRQFQIVNIKKFINNIVSASPNQDGYLDVKTKYPVDRTIIVNIGFNYNNGSSINNSVTLKVGESKALLEIPKGFLNGVNGSISIRIVSPITDGIYKYTSELDNIQDEYIYEDVGIEGDYIYHCNAGESIIVFTLVKSAIVGGEDTNNIYKLSFDNDDIINSELIYSGNLNLNEESTIDSLFHFETEDVQKLYWVDGINPNRVININKVYSKNEDLGFQPSIKMFPQVSITKEYNSLGRFNAGVVQYFITYYNKYESETGIVYQSNINYITPLSRGGKVNETCNCSFTLNISNVDTSFDYIRVYSAQRTSIDGPLEVHIVKDVKINSNSVEILDNNVSQQAVDSNILLYLGGQSFIASTLCQKDNTLFLGNISLQETDISTEDINTVSKNCITDSDIKQCNCIDEDYSALGSIYTGDKLKYFKSGEIYRFAIQFQDEKGVWTSPVWIGDYSPKLKPRTASLSRAVNISEEISVPTSIFKYPNIEVDSKYKNYRILRAETNYNNRSIVAQGILCPTLFNYEDRYNNSPFAVASWIMRPQDGDVPFRHLEGMQPFGELQNVNDTQAVPKVTEVSNTRRVVLVFSKVMSEIGIEWFAAEILPGNASNPENIYKGNVNLLTTINSYGYDELTSETYNYIVEELNKVGIDFTEYVSEDTFCNYYPFMWDGWNEGTNNDADSPYGLPWGYLTTAPAMYRMVNADYPSWNDIQEDVNLKKNNFYVDTNILTFHTPNIDSIYDLVDGKSLNVRVVGCSNVEDTRNKFILNTKSVGVNLKTSILNGKSTDGTLVAEYLYRDYSLVGNDYKSTNTSYKVHMWNKTGSLSGWTPNTTKLGKEFSIDYIPSELKHKIFANYRNATKFKYFSTDINYGNVDTAVFNSEEITTKPLKVDNKLLYYYGNVDKLITDTEYKIDTTYHQGIDTSDNAVIQSDSIRIKYKSTPHIVFGLPGNKLLPRKNGKASYDINNIYNYDSNLNDYFFAWTTDKVEYTDEDFIAQGVSGPVIYTAELYVDIPYESLYGGYSKDDLEKISWVPASIATKIGDNTTLFGDTYFNSWECLKTYPFTEEDENSVVDITKVFIESFDNLEGRSDVNTDGNNLLNARPTNFNIFNQVYNQEDNIFKYYILDEKFDTSELSNQIVWSLAKSPNDDIDLWSNVTLASVLNLDGSYGKITKLLNTNDNIIVFQDKAISTIQYNERVQLSTESGLPVEIQNSGKVTGYQYMSTSNGCSDRDGIVSTMSGIYFIDHFNKSFNRFGKDGISNVSVLGMSNWFKNNNLFKMKLYYDSITHDVYVNNNISSLLFNEDLNSFTSFMDYINKSAIFNNRGKSFLIKTSGPIKVYEMFGGDYGVGIDNKPIDYSIEYVVNPDPNLDKTFTNIEFIADLVDSENKYASPNTFVEGKPFDAIEIWNDYQYGKTNLEFGVFGTLQRKYKIWRSQLPRDENSRFKNDRIRGPWVHLKLSKNSGNKKMIFHSLNIKYFK